MYVHRASSTLFICTLSPNQSPTYVTSPTLCLFMCERDMLFYVTSSQGPKTMETREVSTKVLLDQVPSIMRAIGFYPTEQEVSIVWLPCVL